MMKVLRALAFLQVVGAKLVPLATFDGAKATSYTWETVNDPVMGGQSTSTFEMDQARAVGIWDGEVKIVPFLKAPGFCNLQAPGLNKKADFPDASGTEGIVVVAREASTAGLTHFNVQIMTKGATHLFFQQGVYTGNFTMSDTMEPQFIPWDKFQCTWRGEKVSWCPELSTQLAQITNIGIGTAFPGTAGKFYVEVANLTASTFFEGASSLKTRSESGPVGDTDDTVDLAVFGDENRRIWKTEDDPVMGGQSDSKIVVHDGGEDEASYANYTGTCRIVPKLQAPGFTFAYTDGQLTTSFPDVSKMDGILLRVRNMDANITKFKFAFCDSHINPYACQFKTYKADFSVEPTTGFVEIFLPWSKFSNQWSPATGEHTAENPPKASSLSSITQLQIWVEGVAGHFHLQVRGIRAGKAPKETWAETPILV